MLLPSSTECLQKELLRQQQQQQQLAALLNLSSSSSVGGSSLINLVLNSNRYLISFFTFYTYILLDLVVLQPRFFSLFSMVVWVCNLVLLVDCIITAHF